MENKNFAFGGITRSIGSAVCADGDLHTAVDVCNDGVGLQLLEKPRELFELRNEEDTTSHLKYTEDLLCIHEPEGEGKHYITQMFVESTATPSAQNDNEEETPSDDSEEDDNEGTTATRDGGGSESEGSGESSGDSEGEGDPSDPVASDDPTEPLTPSEPVEHNYVVPDATYWNPDSLDPEPTWAPLDNDSPLLEWEAREQVQRDSDNGGTSYVPSGSQTPHPGVYLCWHSLDETQSPAVHTLEDMIDITPYGKITAIQPMGNTLICNHEGGTETVEVDGTSETITYPAELRYWLWKADNMETVDGQEVNVPKYIGLGSKPPMVNITFSLESEFKYWPEKKSTILNTGNAATYKNYGGVTITSSAYTDTFPVFYSLGNSPNWSNYAPGAVAPYDILKTMTYGGNQTTTEHFGTLESTTPVLNYWQPTFTVEGLSSPDNKTDVAGIKMNWTTMALGCYNKFIYEQMKENKFVFSFYVRYAYELYDGSLIMHSNPILMIPNSRGPIFALDGRNGLYAALEHVDDTYERVDITFKGRTYGFASTLMHKIAQLSDADQKRLEKWKDLIRGINIYITPPIYNYNQGGQVLGWHCMSDQDPSNGVNAQSEGDVVWNRYYTIGRIKGYQSTIHQTDTTPVSLKRGFTDILPDTTNEGEIFLPFTSSYPAPDYCLTIPQKDDGDIYELHENAGQFFLLASIDYEKLIDITATGIGEFAVDIKGKRVKTISNQTVMQDDNGSHDTMKAEVLYGYNRRLNMAKVSKILHSPLKPSVTWARDYTSFTGYSTEKSTYVIYVFAKNGQKIARLKTTESVVDTYKPQYFFYPDTNAYKALIFQGDDVQYMLKLKESKVLNGAFWLSNFLDKHNGIDECLLTNTTVEDLPEINKIVDDSNKIYTSETDNPFVVPFGNINIAGGGDVRALAAATQAMSQGQFGQHPMYTFTSEGVWAMTVNDTGGWATIQPVTRDVITEGTKPLSLDSTVVFLGDRGLLQLGGTETTPLSGAVRSYDSAVFSKILPLSQATGMTDLLAAANSLLAFPDVAVLTYDARSSRIYVTPENVEASWVYNLKSGLWTQATTHIDRQVTTYPECEGQQGNMIVEIGGELGYQKDSGLVITRPVKFGDGAVLRRIHEMAVRGQFKPYSGTVKTALWGTRDWINNALVASSQNNRITRWGGSPYFGHSIGLFITQPAGYLLHAVGVDAAIDVEHFNKLR